MSFVGCVEEIGRNTELTLADFTLATNTILLTKSKRNFLFALISSFFFNLIQLFLIMFKNGEAKSELDLYIFHFHRYNSYRMALKVAKEQREESEKRGERIAEKLQIKKQEVVFLREATEALSEHKRVLMWSYCYAYFLNKEDKCGKKREEGNEEEENGSGELRKEEKGRLPNQENEEEKSKELQLFLFLQEQLEKYSNYLSEIYEKDEQLISNYEQFKQFKEIVTTNTRITNNFLNNFVSGVANGLTCN